jgi:hypothetical protein
MGAALMGAALIASPLSAALAQSEVTPPPHQTQPVQMAPDQPVPGHPPAAHTQPMRRAETVDQRIATLHAQLKITPAEETDWQAVAQTMRDNVAAMQKLASEKASQPSMTAVEDLQTYQQLAQAHVDGLTKLVASFSTLYNEMSDPQKKLADQVFQHSRREPPRPS